MCDIEDRIREIAEEVVDNDDSASQVEDALYDITRDVEQLRFDLDDVPDKYSIEETVNGAISDLRAEMLAAIDEATRKNETPTVETDASPLVELENKVDTLAKAIVDLEDKLEGVVNAAESFARDLGYL